MGCQRRNDKLWCQFFKSRVYGRRNECTEMQQLAIQSAELYYYPLCKDDKSYDGCQCQRSYSLRTNLCFCVNEHGDPIDGQSMEFEKGDDAIMSWQEVCVNVLACPNSDVTLTNDEQILIHSTASDGVQPLTTNEQNNSMNTLNIIDEVLPDSASPPAAHHFVFDNTLSVNVIGFILAIYGMT